MVVGGHYEKEEFNNSITGKECIEYLKKIQSSKITEREANEICNKYTMLFVKERKLNGSSNMPPYIRNNYIPNILFKQYNITVVSNEEEWKTKEYHTNHAYNVAKNYHENKTNNISSNGGVRFSYNEYLPEKKTAPTLIDGWIIYIVIMIFLAIFNERIIGWVFTTIIFLIWRKHEIDKYN